MPAEARTPRRSRVGAAAKEDIRKRWRDSQLGTASAEFARERATRVAEGEGDMALHGAPHALHTFSLHLNEHIQEGLNSHTAAKDMRAWDMWCDICEELGTNPRRTPEEVRDFPERNAFLLACLLMRASVVCTPRDPSRRCIRPRSALAYPLAVIRIFKRWGVRMPSHAELRAAVGGLSRQYLAYHGPQSLAPNRAEPMKFSMVRAMVQDIEPGTVIGRIAWRDQNRDVFNFRRLCVVLMFTGFRLGEIVGVTNGELACLTFGHLSWSIDGVTVCRPTAAQMRRLRPGISFARLVPCRSKTDQTGEIHCPFPVTLTFYDEPTNPAAALRDLELSTGIACKSRDDTPLFCDGSEQPYTHAYLDRLLTDVLAHCFGDVAARLFRWHSFRSGLATALAAAGVGKSESCSSAAGCLQPLCTSTAASAPPRTNASSGSHRKPTSTRSSRRTLSTPAVTSALPTFSTPSATQRAPRGKSKWRGPPRRQEPPT